ncbi:MAG: triose-phosphate isomerase [Chloroflexi bacterium]|nr:triose-phosphate isomerase [Chloroflexota bacterium]
MRQRLVVGNWKMNPSTLEAAVDLATRIARIDGGPIDVGIAPPHVALARVREAIGGSAVLVYAQDVHWETEGAFTGQIAAPMIAGIAAGSIVGHSEVRRDQGDDDARVARKAAAALAHGLRVIFCLGESLAQRRAGETDAVLRRQVRDGIGPLDRERATPSTLAIAYEPIWAIGTGEAATAAQATDAVARIRDELGRLGAAAGAFTVMYGGSVTGANAAEFAAAEGVDGALVGGASLKPEEFAAIVAAFR